MNKLEVMISLLEHNQKTLNKLLQEANISTLQQLSEISGVGEAQLWRLQHGLIGKMPVETVCKISAALNVPVDTFINLFLPNSIITVITKITQPGVTTQPANLSQDESWLKLEYQRLKEQMKQQQSNLQQEWQKSTLEILEPWLLQWPTAKAAALHNPQLPAAKIIPLLKPLEQLLEKWEIEPIGSPGEHLGFDPYTHQLMEGTAQPGDPVKVRYVGYRLADKLLYRAFVIPV